MVLIPPMKKHNRFPRKWFFRLLLALLGFYILLRVVPLPVQKLQGDRA